MSEPLFPVIQTTPEHECDGTPIEGRDGDWIVKGMRHADGTVHLDSFTHEPPEESLRHGLQAVRVELHAAIAALPEPTLGLKGGVNRAAVLRIVDGEP